MDEKVLRREAGQKTLSGLEVDNTAIELSAGGRITIETPCMSRVSLQNTIVEFTR